MAFRDVSLCSSALMVGKLLDMGLLTTQDAEAGKGIGCSDTG